MRRRCDGTDPNLAKRASADDRDGSTTYPPDRERPMLVACDCGRVFDDTQRSTIYPHEILL